MEITHERHCNETNDQMLNVFQRIWHFIKRVVKKYQEWETMKAQHRQLLNMSDHMLKDIGLSRADAVRLTEGYRFREFMAEPESSRIDKHPVRHSRDV